MSTVPLLDFSGHRWELTSNNPEVYLMLTTMRNAPAVWRLVPAANIVCPPVGQLPRPGEPLTALQRLRPFQLMVVTDRSVILLGSGRLFGRANRGKEIVTMLKPCSQLLLLIVSVGGGGVLSLVQPDIIPHWDALMRRGLCNSEAYRLTVAAFPETILPVHAVNM